MKAQPFTDKVLGDYKPSKKDTTKTHFCFRREATLTLHKMHAQDFIDPETGKNQIIFGEVTLIEKKLVDKNTSDFSIFREIKKTPNSVVENVI